MAFFESGRNDFFFQARVNNDVQDSSGALSGTALSYDHGVERDRGSRGHFLLSKTLLFGAGPVFGDGDDNLLIGTLWADKIFGNNPFAPAPSASFVRAIYNPNPGVNDYSGFSAASSGDLVVYTTPRDDTFATNSGALQIYNLMTGALVQTIYNPTPAVGDEFGSLIALDGDILVTHAIRDDTGAPNAGSAYIYDVTTGTLLHTINNPTPITNGFFGHSLSLDGDYLGIGVFYDDAVAVDSGIAYIYDVTTGALLHTLNNPTPAAGDFFGGIAVDGNYALVTAQQDDTGAIDAGIAYVYDVPTGNLLYTLDNPDPDAGDRFGGTYAIDGNYALVGALGDDTGAVDAGSVYVYDVPTGNLLYTIHNPAPTNNDYFGTMDIEGDYAVIGASGNDTGATDSGIAYIYNLSTGTLLYTLNNPDPGVGDWFGNSASIEGNTVIISANGDSTVGTKAGAIYVYHMDFADNDVLVGLTGDDMLFGLYGEDTLYGGIGRDVLYGGADDDILYGGFGRDTLYGGAGEDVLYGGANGDTFVFEAANAFDGVDTIKDFSLAPKDVLDISDILTGYNSGTDDLLDFVQILDSGADSVLYVDATGSADFSAANLIAVIEGVTGLTDEYALEASGRLIV